MTQAFGRRFPDNPFTGFLCLKLYTRVNYCSLKLNYFRKRFWHIDPRKGYRSVHGCVVWGYNQLIVKSSHHNTASGCHHHWASFLDTSSPHSSACSHYSLSFFFPHYHILSILYLHTKYTYINSISSKSPISETFPPFYQIYMCCSLSRLNRGFVYKLASFATFHYW